MSRMVREYPFLRKNAAIWEPIKPAPPVIRAWMVNSPQSRFDSAGVDLVEWILAHPEIYYMRTVRQILKCRCKLLLRSGSRLSDDFVSIEARRVANRVAEIPCRRKKGEWLMPEPYRNQSVLKNRQFNQFKRRRSCTPPLRNRFFIDFFK